MIEKLPPPTSVKGVRSSPKHVGFYIKITKPLTQLLTKDVPFEFDKEFLSAL